MLTLRKYMLAIALLSLSGAAAADPIKLTDCAGLQNIYNHLTGQYILANNIDCTGFAFQPINQRDPFTGSLDGQGFTITGLSIVLPTYQSSSYISALFAIVHNAVIQNINFKNAYINNVDFKTNEENYSGLIAGQIKGNTTIANIKVDGLTIGAGQNVSNLYYTGGIVGQTNDNSVLRNVHVKNAEISNGDGAVGGLIGQTRGNTTIEGSSVYGIDPIKKQGYLCRRHDSLCAFGGLIGDASPGTINIQYSWTEGYINSSNDVGGLIGRVNATVNISNSYSMTKVESVSNAGGLIGATMDNAVINLNTVYAAGKVAKVGNGPVSHWAIIGSVSPANPPIVGHESYYDQSEHGTNRKSPNDNVSIGLSKKEMTANPQGRRFHFANWDTNIWSFGNDKYPQLNSNARPSSNQSLPPTLP